MLEVTGEHGTGDEDDPGLQPEHLKEQTRCFLRWGRLRGSQDMAASVERRCVCRLPSQVLGDFPPHKSISQEAISCFLPISASLRDVPSILCHPPAPVTSDGIASSSPALTPLHGHHGTTMSFSLSLPSPRAQRPSPARSERPAFVSQPGAREHQGRPQRTTVFLCQGTLQGVSIPKCGQWLPLPGSPTALAKAFICVPFLSPMEGDEWLSAALRALPRRENRSRTGLSRARGQINGKYPKSQITEGSMRRSGK